MGELPLSNGFYIDESLPLSHQECVNIFPETPQVKSLSKLILRGAPGSYEITNTGVVHQQSRGSWVKNGIPYVVNGTSLYSVSETIDSEGNELYSHTELGTVAGSGRVSMANSPTELMILNPSEKGYIYNEDAVIPFQEIVDLDFRANGNPTHVIFVDGSFFCTTDEDKIIVSDLQDGLSWNALLFGSAESDPDKVVAPVKVDNQVYVLGGETTDGYQNIGGSGFPYQRNNVFMDKGCFAPFSIVNTNKTFFMIGGGKNEQPAVWQFNGTSYDKRSTYAVDAILAGYTEEEISEAFGMYYGIKGHYFVVFVFPDRALQYDLVEQKWSERKSTIDEVPSRWRVNSIVTAYNKLIVSDFKDGRIGILDTETYGEYGEDIISVWSTQPFLAIDGIKVPAVELVMESGVGNTGCPDPQVGLSFSRDGKKFNYERTRAIGKKGQYKLRQIWRGNGHYTRMLTLRFRISDQVKKVAYYLEAA